METVLQVVDPPAKSFTKQVQDGKKSLDAGDLNSAVDVLMSAIVGIEAQKDRGVAAEEVSETAFVENLSEVQEAAVVLFGDVYHGFAGSRSDLVHRVFALIKSDLSTVPKARAAKIVRTIIDLVARVLGGVELQEQLCRETISWCIEEKRTFLKHRVELRLATLYHQVGRYQQGFEIVARLLSEVKKLGDKLLLVEINLIEAKLYFATKNVARAKAALTAARSNANAIHCPPLLQADIDVMAGALHAEENDHKTAFSYFYEGFDAFNLAEDNRALLALKYMLLSKIMCNQASEVMNFVSGRQYMKYRGRDLEALKGIAECYEQRSLKLFEETLQEYSKELREDPVIQRHIDALYKALLEQNIVKVLEPFSCVEVTHIAELLDLPRDKVQAKLGEMILDKKLCATLDQGAGTLIIFDQTQLSSIHEDVLATLSSLSSVVDLLYVKAQKVI